MTLTDLQEVALCHGWVDNLGQRVDDPRQAEELVGEIRLLTTAEFRALFPDATISNERVLGLTKSLMAIKD